MPATYAPLVASGGCAPIVLVEVQTAAGNNYFWSEHKCQWLSILTGAPEQFLDWIVGTPTIKNYGSVQTDTASIAVQNISGNTVERDAAKLFSTSEFIGAFVVLRIWRGDAEQSLQTFTGNVATAEIDDAQLSLTVEGFGSWSNTPAPAYNIDTACPLAFGSIACGSTAATPCDQSYGKCSQINRFAGVITQWDQECPNSQVAQPAPIVFFNPARPF